MYFRADVNVGQDSALFFILSALYIILIFHIFEKRTKNLLSNISISTLSFVEIKRLLSLYFLGKKLQKIKHKFIL